MNFAEILKAKIDKASEAAVQRIADEIADAAENYVPEDFIAVKDSISVKVDGYKTRGPEREEQWEDEEDQPRKKGEHSAEIYTDDDDGMALEFGTHKTEANPFLSRAFYEALDSGEMHNIIVEEFKKEFKK